MKFPCGDGLFSGAMSVFVTVLFSQNNIYPLRKPNAMEAWTTKLGLKSSYIIFCFKRVICQAIQLSMQSLVSEYQSISNPLVFVLNRLIHKLYYFHAFPYDLLDDFPHKLDRLTFSTPSWVSKHKQVDRTQVLRHVWVASLGKIRISLPWMSCRGNH